MSKIDDVMKRDAGFYWKRYEKGIDYINTKDLIGQTNKNWNFYIGNQWEGLQTRNRQTPPFYNFIQRHIDHKVSSISQTAMTVRYSDLENRGNDEVYEKLNGLYESAREKGKLNLVDRQTAKEAAITGDGIQYYGSGNIEDVQRLDTTSVLYGNESEPDIQKQPYIIIRERLSLETVRRIAAENGKTADEIRTITTDSDTDNIIGNRDELEYSNESPEAKVTCLITLEKIEGVVYTCRSTRTLIFEDMHPLTATNGLNQRRSMTLYPLLKMAWNDLPNDARGVSEVKYMIPNQIELNQTLARISVTNKQMAFPRLAVLANSVINRDELNKVGGIIELSESDMSVNQMVQYLQPAQISSEPRNYANDILQTTQELSGSGETAMGNINPNRVAASAYTEIRDQANLILGEKEERAVQFVEDRARLFVEMWSVYNTDGIIYTKEVIDDETGEIKTESVKISPDELNDLKPEVRVDVSKTDAWSKEAEQQYVDTLLTENKITLEEALELYSDSGYIPKQGLRRIMAKRKQQQRLQEEQMLRQQMAGEEMTPQDVEAQAIQAWQAQDEQIQEPQVNESVQ